VRAVKQIQSSHVTTSVGCWFRPGLSRKHAGAHAVVIPLSRKAACNLGDYSPILSNPKHNRALQYGCRSIAGRLGFVCGIAQTSGWKWALQIRPPNHEEESSSFHTIDAIFGAFSRPRPRAISRAGRCSERAAFFPCVNRPVDLPAPVGGSQGAGQRGGSWESLRPAVGSAVR
jgi:hypothetical protein